MGVACRGGGGFPRGGGGRGLWGGGVYRGGGGGALPTYAFQPRRYWLASSAVVDIGDQAERVLWKAVDEDALQTVAETLRISDAASLGPVVHALREWRKD